MLMFAVDFEAQRISVILVALWLGNSASATHDEGGCEQSGSTAIISAKACQGLEDFGERKGKTNFCLVYGWESGSISFGSRITCSRATLT